MNMHVIDGLGRRFLVCIRRDKGDVRPNAEQLHGKFFVFRDGWIAEAESTYAGEMVMLPNDPTYPEDAPHWIARGDLLAPGEYRVNYEPNAIVWTHNYEPHRYRADEMSADEFQSIARERQRALSPPEDV